MANRGSYQVYAEALFSLAQEERKVKEYQSELNKIRDEFESRPDLLNVLSSYAIDKKSLYELSDKLFSSSTCPSLSGFMKVLISHHLISHFADVEDAFHSLSNESLGIKEGIVYSTEPLNKEDIANVEKALESRLNSKVYLTNRVDKGLIGGLKVAIDGKVFDGSIENRVEALREKLLKQAGGEL